MCARICIPFVIGVMGAGGLKDESAGMLAIRQAMAAPADLPEFKGNVAAVQTAPLWSDELGEIDNKRAQVAGTGLSRPPPRAC
jgi:hypothetical protein